MRIYLFIHHHHIHLIEPGVEFELYNKAFTDKLPIPEDIKNIEKPIIGYMGCLDGRSDYGLLEYMANKKPLWSIVFLGPIEVKEERRSLNKYKNVHFLGVKERKEELPNYIQMFDVCIIPYRVYDFSKTIYPSKTFEYLATGKPVVTSYLPSLDDLAKNNIIKMAKFKEGAFEENYEEFISLIEDSLNEKDDEAIKRRVEYAKEASWDSKVELRLKLIEQLGKL
ncbi:MAG: glycosyltransferase [Nitrospirota bacterium]